MTHTKGIQRIAAAFNQTRTEQRAALIPYVALGHPTPEMSLKLAAAAIESGADLLELGVPFSDPLADGPIIQRATHTALQQGTTVVRCLELAQTVRQRKPEIPLIFMGYYNPILTYGEDAFCRACDVAGVDGLIVPDLPPEEGRELEAACQVHGLALIYLLAPTSTPQRVGLVTQHSQGFVYLVSVTGITGPRDRLPADLHAFVKRVRAATDKPLAVGFGIASAQQAGQVAALADGVIVGSALVRLAEEVNAESKVRSFVAGLRDAMVTQQGSLDSSRDEHSRRKT